MKSLLSTLAATLLLAPALAAAQEAPPAEGAPVDTGPTLSFAPKVGATVATSELGTTFFAGADVIYHLNRNLGLGVEFAFAQPGLSGGGTHPVVGDYTYQLQQRWMMGSLDALGFVPLGALEAYGGVGYGIYLLRVQTDSFDQTTVETQTRSGLQLRAGAGLAVGPGRLFLEARYHYVGLEFLTTGQASSGGITAAAGYRFGF